MTRNVARVFFLSALTMAFAGGAAAATLAELERAFWLCDYAGTTGSLGMGAAGACSSIYEELKIQKFKGDFDSMWVWWQQSKLTQHRAIAAASH